MRRIGVLMTTASEDPESHTRLAPFVKGLKDWAGPMAAMSNPTSVLAQTLPPSQARNGNDHTRADVILAQGSAAAGPLLQTHTVPIAFAILADPVGAGFVDSLARPDGSTTGFTQWDRFHSSVCRENRRTPPWFTPTERPGPLAPSGGPGLAQRTGSGGALCQFHSYQNA
jgi:hypothetical protein